MLIDDLWRFIVHYVSLINWVLISDEESAAIEEADGSHFERLQIQSLISDYREVLMDKSIEEQQIIFDGFINSYENKNITF